MQRKPFLAVLLAVASLSTLSRADVTPQHSFL